MLSAKRADVGFPSKVAGFELPATNNGARRRIEARVAATRLDRAFRYVPLLIDEILYGNDTLLVPLQGFPRIVLGAAGV